MATIPVGLTSFPTVDQGDRGVLIFIEGNTHIPFDIKRVFYILDANDKIIRGGHAHKECEQVMIAVSGHVIVETEKDWFVLGSPTEGLYIPPGVCVEMCEFSHDCVLLVLCSHHFSEEDYVDTVENHIER